MEKQKWKELEKLWIWCHEKWCHNVGDSGTQASWILSWCATKIEGNPEEEAITRVKGKNKNKYFIVGGTNNTEVSNKSEKKMRLP